MVKNSILNGIGAGARMLFAVLAIPLLIRQLGLIDFGVWNVALTFFSVILLAEGGISIATTVFLARSLEKKESNEINQVLSNSLVFILILSTGASLLTYLFAPALVALFDRSLSLEQLTVAEKAVEVSAIAAWFRINQQFFAGIVQAFGRYDIYSLLFTIQALLANSLGLIVIAAFGGGPVQLMWGVSFFSGCVLLIYLGMTLRLLKDYPLRFSWSWAKGSEIARHSLTVWLTSIGGTLFSQGDRLLVAALLSIEEFSIYVAVIGVARQINTLSGILAQPLLPVVSRAKEKLDFTSIRSALEQNMLLLVLGITTIVFFLILDAPFVMNILFNQPETDSYLLGYRVAIAVYGLYSLNAFGYYILFGIDQVRVNTLMVLGSGVVSLVFIYFLSQRFGLSGAFYGNAGFLFTLYLTYAGINRIAPGNKNLRNILLAALVLIPLLAGWSSLADYFHPVIYFGVAFFIFGSGWYILFQFTGFHHRLLQALTEKRST